jgi:hypothetical protein
MANSTPSRPGFKAGGAAGNLDLFLDLFAGEVLSTYEAKTQMRALHRVVNLNGGKSYRYPVMGQATGGYHTPGTEITGDQIQHDEIVVTPDDKLVSSVFIADIDEALNHYEVRSAYADEIGGFLARHYDANVIRAIIKAARDAGKLGQAGGNVTNTALLTDVTKLFDSFAEAKKVMDLKNVDVDTKKLYGMVSTPQWYALKQSDKNLNRDYNGGTADVRNMALTTIDGIEIRKSNLAPFGVNQSATVGIPARYQGDYSKTVGIVWTEDAAVTAEVQSVSIQHDEQISKQGHLIVGRYMSGTNVLRATDAVELRTGAPT